MSENLGTLFVVEVTRKNGKVTTHGARTNNPVTEDWVAHHLAELGVHGEDAEHIHVKLSDSNAPKKLEDIVKQKPRIAPTVSTHANPDKRMTPQTKKRVDEHADASAQLKAQEDSVTAASLQEAPKAVEEPVLVTSPADAEARASDE